jgi:hypothetical protein
VTPLNGNESLAPRYNFGTTELSSEAIRLYESQGLQKRFTFSRPLIPEPHVEGLKVLRRAA